MVAGRQAKGCEAVRQQYAGQAGRKEGQEACEERVKGRQRQAGCVRQAENEGGQAC